MVVLAGGLGTRLGALRKSGPKILQTVAGEPFINHLLRSYQRLGLTSAHLCLGYRSAEVVNYLRVSRAAEVEVTWSLDPVPNSGTAAALRAAAPFVAEGFLLWLGDTYVTPDFVLPDQAARPLMFLTDRCADVVPNAALAPDGTVRYCKAGGPGFSLVDAGLAVMDASFFDDPQVSTLTSLEDCWTALSDQGRLTGCRITAEVFDIGTPERIDTLERHLMGLST